MQHLVRKNTKLFCLIGLSLCLNFKSIADEWQLSYQNQYISEGINNIDSPTIVWLATEHSLNANLVVALEYGLTTDNQYDELNLIAAYANKIRHIDYRLFISKLFYFKDDASELELGAEFEYALTDTLTSQLFMVHSRLSDGEYAEFTLSQRLFTEHSQQTAWQVSSYLKLAYDHGYVAENRSGYNHTALGFLLDYPLNQTIGLNFTIEKNWASYQANQVSTEHNPVWLSLQLNGTF